VIAVSIWKYLIVELIRNYSAPLFEKRGVRGDFLNKSPSFPPFSKGEVNNYADFAILVIDVGSVIT
jgi:hypothetical protein